MDLKRINDIKTLDRAHFIAYANQVIGECTMFSREDACSLLELAQRDAYVSPTPDFVRKYVLAFLIEHFEDITYRIFSIEYLHMFADTGIWVLYWTIGGRNPRFITLDTEEKKDFIEGALMAIEAGIPREDLTQITIPLLEEDTEELARQQDLLSLLGVNNTPATIIPILSDTLDLDESTARFSTAIWYEEIQKKTIILAGMGGIGSYVAFLLARMHPRSLFIYDDDRVEIVNMAGQLYKLNDVGKFKVDAIANTIREFSSYSSTFAVRERFTRSSEAADIMICGFDNMEARRIFFDKWLANVMQKTDEEKEHCLFIDGRLAAEELQVLCLKGDDTYNIERYSSDFLFSDAEADETLCSYKQTTYMANMIGSIMVNLFTNFVANELVANLRDLPFFTSYSADSMMFKTEQ